MNLVVETDLGHDPDDFFALLYLAGAGVNIRAICVTPGDPDQVAVARFLCKHLGLDIPVGVSHLDRRKNSSGGMHHHVLNKFGHPVQSSHDGLGSEIIKEVWGDDPDVELFVIGPVISVGKFLKETDATITRATMQGGFVPYHLHDFPCTRLEKFEGQSSQPTFNLNGGRDAGMVFLNADIGERRFVSKNVCHTVVYDRERHDWMTSGGSNSPSGVLFKEGMDYYLSHHDSKKFHDPTAAVCHLHPDVGSWVRGRMVKVGSGWGASLDGDDYLIADIDYNALWERLRDGVG